MLNVCRRCRQVTGSAASFSRIAENRAPFARAHGGVSSPGNLAERGAARLGANAPLLERPAVPSPCRLALRHRARELYGADSAPSDPGASIHGLVRSGASGCGVTEHGRSDDGSATPTGHRG